MCLHMHQHVRIHIVMPHTHHLRSMYVVQKYVGLLNVIRLHIGFNLLLRLKYMIRHLFLSGD